MIACLIANFHAAVFYVFFILMMPYLGEYLVVFIRDSFFGAKMQVYFWERRLEKLCQTEQGQEKIEKAQEKLLQRRERLARKKERAKKREENAYKIKLIKRDTTKWLFLIAILCFAMGLLTPIGDEPYSHLLKLLSGNTTQSISEHQPLVLAEHTGAIISLIMLFGFLTFTKAKITLKDGFMLGGLLLLTFMARRQFSLLLVVGVMSLTRIICDFIEQCNNRWQDKMIENFVTWKGKVFVIVCIVLLSFWMHHEMIDDKYIDDTSYPVEAANFLLEQEAVENLNFETMKLFNDYNYGSYLLFRGIPVYIDSRADLYSPEFNKDTTIFDDYMDISSIGVYYEDKFEEYEITHIISYTNSKLTMLLEKDENYKELYKDDYFIIYERLNANAS